MAAYPRCRTCRRPIRDPKMLRNPKTGACYHPRASCRPGMPHRTPRHNIFGFHPVTGPIRRSLAARKLRKAGFSPQKAKALAATKNPARPTRLPGGMMLYHGWLIDGNRGQWFVRDLHAKESDPTYGPVDTIYSAMATIDWHRNRPTEAQAAAVHGNPAETHPMNCPKCGVPGKVTRGPFGQYRFECKACGAYGAILLKPRKNPDGNSLYEVELKKGGKVFSILIQARNAHQAGDLALRLSHEKAEFVSAARVNPHYPVIRGKAFERSFERMVRAIKRRGNLVSKTGRLASPWAIATARLGGYPSSRAAKNRNPSRSVRRRLSVLKSHERSFTRRHRRAVKFARRAGRVGAAAARGAFPEVARPAAGLRSAYAEARRNPANKAAAHYLDLARTYISKGAFRAADDFIQRAQRVASPDSMVAIEAAEMRGRLTQALLDRQPGGLGRMWAKVGKNPKVDGSQLVEIVYREPNGQLWRHSSGEVTGVPRRLHVRKGKSGDTVSFRTRVSKRGIVD